MKLRYLIFVLACCGCCDSQLAEKPRTITSSKAAKDTSSDVNSEVFYKSNITIAPKTTGYTAYEKATNHAISIGYIDSVSNYEFTVLYDQKNAVWTVFYRRLPYRLGHFFSIIVNGNDGSIIDVQRGE